MFNINLKYVFLLTYLNLAPNCRTLTYGSYLNPHRENSSSCYLTLFEVIQASMKLKNNNNFHKTLDHVALICGISKHQAITS